MPTTDPPAFFELVYFLSGTKLQGINNNKFLYLKGHLFLITPGDVYAFEIYTLTKLGNGKFNGIYIHFGVEEALKIY